MHQLSQYFRKVVAIRDKPTPRMTGTMIGFANSIFFIRIVFAETPNPELL